MLALLRRLLFDEDAFLKLGSKLAAQLRALILGLAFVGTAMADDIAAFLGDESPGYVKRVRIAIGLLGALAGLLRAGDRTPPEVKAFATGLTPPPYRVAPPAKDGTAP